MSILRAPPRWSLKYEERTASILAAEDVFDEVVSSMVAELRKTTEAKAYIGSVALIYIFIDSMAWAGLPAGRDQVTRSDFTAWVDRFMVVPILAEYHYSGADLYAARCGLLHTYSPKEAPSGRRFVYQDGSPHRYRPDMSELVVLSIPLLIDDLFAAIARFVSDVRKRSDSAVVEKRLGEMIRMLPFKGKFAAERHKASE